jgi:hypothetical protein
MEPCRDMTPEQVADMIFPTADEIKRGVIPIRLVEDFLIGRNIARYGLKFKMIKTLMKEWEVENAQMFFHVYALPKVEKVFKMAEIYKVWGFDLPESVKLALNPQTPEAPKIEPEIAQ